VATSEKAAASYRFGLFEVDNRTRELRKQGVRLRLRGRPIDLLLVLLEKPGEIVTRDDLRGRLWPADTFVDFDHGLHSAVNRLRETLGESAGNPRFIETLPRRGYRFIAPVTVVSHQPSASSATPVDPPPSEAQEITDVGRTRHVTGPAEDRRSNIPTSPSPSRRRRLALPIVLAIVAAIAAGLMLSRGGFVSPGGARPMTIAVLPFQNLSGDPDEDYFSDGVTEEMIAALGMIGPDRLTVIGRTTSMLYKGARKSIGQIGQELGVTYLLEGSVRRAGSRMRITAQLVDTRNMAHLWSESYDRDIGDVLSVQSDVARQIARSLALALAPKNELPVSTPPSSFAAYELLMRGRLFRGQATEEGARKAIEYYERAIAIDPNYAAAHAAMADAYRLLGAPGLEIEPPSVLLTKAKAAAERALALDPRSPEARAVLAMIKLNFDWDLPGAELEVKQALRLNPSFAQAHQYYSAILTVMNRVDEAIVAAARAVELDPLAATARATLGVRYYYARRPDEAIQHFVKTLELTPGFAVAHWGLAQCYRLQGRFDDHIDHLRQAVQLSGNSAYMRAHLAYGYAVAGDRARAEAIRHEFESEGQQRYVAPYHLALIAAGLGDTNQAVRWLDQAYNDRSGWLVFLPVEPEFDSMRNAEAFQQLLARVKPQ
jgi:TolB-like protein/DNA-binding winged helix-turn-helix (wHTH) protein/Flp pilus assembly protein TadD